MVEGLKGKSIAYRQRWGEAAEPLKLIERSKVLVENLQIRDIIRRLDDDARSSVRERLNALYADHIERGLIRSGATLRDGIVVFEEEAGGLIDNLLLEVLPLSRSAGAFALILEGVEQFLSLLDGELARIVKKVEYENQDSGAMHGLARTAHSLWAEKRSGLLEDLERHRWEFLVPASEAPAIEAPTDEGADPAGEEAECGEADDDAADPAVAAASEPALAEEENAPQCGPEEDSALPEPAGEDREPALAGHWHDMWAATAMKLWAGTLRPKSQADLAREMEDWFDRQGVRPTEGETDECARRLWTKFAATQRITSSIAPGTDDLTASDFDLLADRPGVGAYSLSSPVDPEQSAEAIASGALRAIPLTAPSLALD